MKSKKDSFLLHHNDIMVEGMIFCIKTFAIVCVITSFVYFAAGTVGRITDFFSL